MCLRAIAMAYSATTVFPADVWAATKTHSFSSRWTMACFWNVSSSNGYCRRRDPATEKNQDDNYTGNDKLLLAANDTSTNNTEITHLTVLYLIYNSFLHLNLTSSSKLLLLPAHQPFCLTSTVKFHIVLCEVVSVWTLHSEYNCPQDHVSHHYRLSSTLFLTSAAPRFHKHFRHISCTSCCSIFWLLSVSLASCTISFSFCSPPLAMQHWPGGSGCNFCRQLLSQAQNGSTWIEWTKRLLLSLKSSNKYAALLPSRHKYFIQSTGSKTSDCWVSPRGPSVGHVDESLEQCQWGLPRLPIHHLTLTEMLLAVDRQTTWWDCQLARKEQSHHYYHVTTPHSLLHYIKCTGYRHKQVIAVAHKCTRPMMAKANMWKDRASLCWAIRCTRWKQCSNNVKFREKRDPVYHDSYHAQTRSIQFFLS